MTAIMELVQIIRENTWIPLGILFGVLGYLAVFFRGALLYEYKRLRERGNDPADEQEREWYQQTATLARQVQRIWEAKCVEPNNRGESFSFEEVQGEMGLLADRLDRHATDIQGSIPPEVENLVYETAQECRSVENTLISLGSKKGFWDQGELAVEKAEKLEEAVEHRLEE